MSAAPVLLRVEGLRLTLPGAARALLDGVSFQLARGECLGVVGASGSGKSLTAGALIGLAPRAATLAGSIRFDGCELIGAAAATLRGVRRGGIATVFQDPLAHLNPVWSVGAQIAEIVRLQQGLARKAAWARAVELLAETGIEQPGERAQAYPHQLSGGQRQRAMIAIALAAQPQLLIADEATSALDARVQRQIVALLERLRERHGLALLFITHDLALAAELCDRVAVMQQGRIVEQESTKALFAAPRHAHTRELMGHHGAVSAVPPAPAAGAATLLEVRGLCARYRAAPTPALQDINFTLARGETLALVGESGSGKSTVARCLLGLLRPSAGTLHFDGVAVATARADGWHPLRRRLQVVFQDPYASLDPRHTVTEALLEPLAIHNLGAGRAERIKRVHALLDRVGLSASLAGRYPHALSGGQRQRVAIARALAVEPECLICDEATSALDVVVQAQILQLLLQLRREHGLSLLFISHDLALVRRLADRIGVLHRGTLVEHGPTETVFAAPRHAHTQALLAAIPGGLRAG